MLIVVGTLAALALQAGQAQRLGGWGGLLMLGEESPSRPMIEAELGQIPLRPGDGQDGKFFYMIARDPFPSDRTHHSYHLREDEPAPGSLLFDRTAYRYTRILYPLLAGFGGLSSAQMALAGLYLWGAIGVGLAMASLDVLTTDLRGRGWVVFTPLMHAGVLSSLALLTSDALAVGLGLSAVAAWMRSRHVSATLLLTGAVLTKELYLLVAVALAALAWRQGRRLEGAGLILGPAVALLAWSLTLVSWTRESMWRGDAFGWPFVGFARTMVNGDIFAASLALFALLTAMAAPYLAWRSRQAVLVYLIVPWTLVAICSSWAVWMHDALRVFAPLLFFTVLAAGILFRRQEEATRSSALLLPPPQPTGVSGLRPNAPGS
jgi:hypothetical protein